jgi:tetratricopeptide (TPR) repeat protein
MAKRSRQRKFQGKRPTQAPAVKTVSIAPAAHKPWRIAVVCLVLAVVTLIAYRGVRSNDFLALDDNEYVTDNFHVQHGVTTQSIAWAFTTNHDANWHPLTWISHMVDWNFYGMNPAGYHMANVCIHAANAILLFLLLLYMTGFLWRSSMVAFMFALHPAHVESVAWIAERKDILCAFFWFAALLAYAWYVRRPSWKRYLLVACCYACSLLSKPMAVTLPFTLLLLDFWPLRRITFSPNTSPHWFSSFWKLCVEKWLFFIMAAASSVVTYIAQRSLGAVVELQSMPLWVRICNAAISYWRYVRIMLWPDPLSVFYYHEKNNIMVSMAVLSLIALILLTAVCWHIRKKRPYCLIGWLWFLGTLVPVIGIVQVGNQALAERYTYVPFIGLFIAIVWLAGDAVANYPKIKAGILLLAVVVIVACAVKTDAQVKVWKDTVTLLRHSLEIDPRGEFTNTFLGIAYMRQGRFAEAEEYFEHALVYNPIWYLPLSSSAYCIIQSSMQTHDTRNLPLAKQRLDLALRVAPDDAFVLTNLALWSVLAGNPKDEEMYSRKAIAANPDFIAARLYLAGALQAQGKLDEAAQECRQVLAVAPNDNDAHNILGYVFDQRGLKQEALKEFRLSVAIKPDQAAIHSQIARILMETHQLPEAVKEFNQVLRYDPANANAHKELGMALLQLGEYEKAAEQFNDAIRINPADVVARLNLDLAHSKMKK